MVYWKEMYTEIAEKIQHFLPKIEFIDLWHEQVSYLTEELPFPTPAVFIDFNTIDTEDMGELVQQLEVQIDMRLFYETFSDTYKGAVMQQEALSFLDSLTELHALFHGKSGTSYSEMRRVYTGREESGGAGNLYRISFQCKAADYSAKELYTDGEFSGIDIVPETIVKPEADQSLYKL